MHRPVLAVKYLKAPEALYSDRRVVIDKDRTAKIDDLIEQLCLCDRLKNEPADVQRETVYRVFGVTGDKDDVCERRLFLDFRR